MKNIAKCKLCQSVIESFHPTDYVMCKCGHIAVDGGEAMRCYATDWRNFIRIDDEGHEIMPKIVEKAYENEPFEPMKKTNKEERIEYIEDMIKHLEKLPQSVMISPLTHYDYVTLLSLIASILKEK